MTHSGHHTKRDKRGRFGAAAEIILWIMFRLYFPKETDVLVHSQMHLSAVTRQLDERARQTLEFETPAG